MDRPFKTDQIVKSPHFTDRENETRRVIRAMRHRERLVLYGERRQGKSSIIARAADKLRAEGGIVISVDVWKLENLEGLNRAILSAIPASWLTGKRLETLGRSLRGVFSLSFDDEGRPVVALGAGRVHDPHPEETLESILRALDEIASQGDAAVVVVIDEFQHLDRLRPDGSALLRSITQETGKLSYVLAGSIVGMVTDLIGPKGPFHGVDRIQIKEIDPSYLGSWIDHRLQTHGVEAEAGLGALIIERAGPVTEYVMRLAKVVHRIGLEAGRADHRTTQLAFDEIVSDQDGTFDLVWDKVSTTKRQILRGIADGEERLTALIFLQRYGIGSSSAASHATRELRNDGILAPGKPHRVSDPFFAAWVRRRT
jgi:uncharacterized protein